MAVVKPDKIIRSKKLNEPLDDLDGRRLSKAAFWSYAHYVATLRDDFGRFLYSPRVCLTKLAPRRPDVTEGEVRNRLEEYRRANLLKVWTENGQEFAEWSTPHVGKRFHGTPEPPWSEHQHGAWCINTAVRQARQWGSANLPGLLILLNEFKSGKKDGRRTGGKDGEHTGEDQKTGPSTSATSSPSATSATSSTSATTETAINDNGQGGGDGGEADLPVEERIARLKPAAIAPKFTGVYNALHKRHCQVTPGVSEGVATLARRWKPWQIIALPIVVEAQHRQGLYPADCIRSKIGILLRTGKNGRVHEGQLLGATCWIERAYEAIDRTVLDGELVDLARQAGVLTQLTASHVRLPAPEEGS